MSKSTSRVAVVGARGIGRHHAKWWHLEGADVCAFAGTSAESVAETERLLHELFGFHGRGYTDVSEMLATEAPDFVDICSPSACHGEHAQMALDAGAHVLCEKPFIYRADLDSKAILRAAEALAEDAEQKNLLLALCSQYAVAAEQCLAVAGAAGVKSPVTTFAGEVASPAKDRGPSPLDVWIDLGPHLLAVVQALRPSGAMDLNALKVEGTDYRGCANFTIRMQSMTDLACQLTAYRTFGEPRNVRRLVYNNLPLDIEGGKDADGVYCTRLVTPTGEFNADDPMRVTIRRMLAGNPSLPSGAALENLRMLLAVADRL